ncbi:hypothetical protein V8E53_015620 [Lactarius tabidus]
MTPNVEAQSCTALGVGPVLSQARKRGCKHTGTPALALPPSPSPLQPPSSWLPHLLYHVWYTQPATFNAAASTPSPSFEGTSTTVAPPPAPAHTVWYPAPAAAAPLGGCYTGHWPYGQFYPPQPR